MKRYWFKNKTYGWGWTPATWEGWLVVAGFTLINILNLIVTNYFSGSDAAELRAAPIFFISIILMLVICVKTGEKPEWRWGEKSPPKKD